MSTKSALSGLRALVTGGTRGIGAAIAERLQAGGVQVTITGTSPEWHGDFDVEYMPVRFDDPESLDTFCTAIEEREFDVLVNNAGINKIGPFIEIDPQDFSRIQHVNVMGPFRVSQAVITGMKGRGWGRIVTLSSIWGRISKEYRASYSASKFAVDGMMAALSAELAGSGILANCVAPGFIDTELTRSVLGEDGIAELVKAVPAGNLGKPEDVANLIAWLVSRENAYVSGQNIVIDGGFTRT